jgi:hypothetical protein
MQPLLVAKVNGMRVAGLPLRNEEMSLTAVGERDWLGADIRKVLADSGIPETSDAVLALLSGATSSVRGGLCTDATPNDGVLVECDFQPGATLEWMAYRPNIGKGNRAPGRIERFRWAGK